MELKRLITRHSDIKKVLTELKAKEIKIQDVEKPDTYPCMMVCYKYYSGPTVDLFYMFVYESDFKTKKEKP
jgi:hypothetical protein